MTTTDLTYRPAVAQMELRDQLNARIGEFAAALPAHITPAHFVRIALTAISQTPELVNADRRSLLNALMRCAQDGLLPDGRQAALVIFRTKDGPKAQYMQMTAGVRKLVQQSGEITRFEQVVVHENDKFDYRLGDRPHINHVPAIENRGKPILVYSIAQFFDGTLSREVMTVDEIEKVRAVSRAADSGPWRDWWSEMAKKTIAKRHAKSLPMSNDAAAVLAKDDDEHTSLPPVASTPVEPARERPRLAAQLDALSRTDEVASELSPRRRRGRPRKDDDLNEAAIERSQALLGAVLGEPPEARDSTESDAIDRTDEPEAPPPDDDWDGRRAAFNRGMKDFADGRTACLDRAINEDPEKKREWQRGFDHAKRN